MKKDSDTLVSAIKKQLLSKPDVRLTEEGLVQKLGVSRTPVREALKTLESEGLILREKKGISLQKLDAKGIADLFDLRAVMEGYAARIVAASATSKDFELLMNFALMYEEAGKKENFQGLGAGSSGFHKTLVALSKNEMLQRIWNTFSIQEQVLKISYEINSPIEWDDNPFSHLQIVEILKTRDADKSEQALRIHIQYARNKLLQKVTGIRMNNL